MQRSHGPSVYFDRETGEPVVKCSTRTIYCGFLSGGRCTEDKLAEGHRGACAVGEPRWTSPPLLRDRPRFGPR